MFTAKELIAELPRLAALESPPLEIIAFGQYDFDRPESEESIWTFRGSKKDFAGGLLFFVKTLHAQEWEDREEYFLPYAQTALCEPMSGAAFGALLTECSYSLVPPLPPFLHNLSGFQSAMRMYADWNDVGAIAELADAFIAFYWDTTA